MKDNRIGFTLVEILVVIAIIAVLFAMILPAVQSARETSRRCMCQNNIRQIAVAIQSYGGKRGHLPSLYNGSFLPQPRDGMDEFHFHSWRSAILGELEQPSIIAAINWSLPASDAKNQTAINCTIPVFICPSTSNTRANVPEVFDFNDPATSVGSAARSDYEAMGGVIVTAPVSPLPNPEFDLSDVRFGAWGEPKYNPVTGKSLNYRTARLAAITDGLSHTLLVGERSGRPDHFERRSEYPYPYAGVLNPPDSQQAAWGISTNYWWFVFWHEQFVNQTNDKGIYGFHPGGANVAFADGSARFLTDSTSPLVLTAMATRAEGDSVNTD